MTTREQFYAKRDQRTIEYGVSDIFGETVALVAGPQAVGCVRGQSAILSLVNMLARMHRSLHLDIPSVPLIRPTVVPADRLDEAARGLARTIDPFIRFDASTRCATGIGLGADAPAGLPWYAGADGQIAMLDRQPVPFDETPTPSLGSCLAACFAASAALQHLLGRPVRPLRVSAWNVCEGDEAAAGPEVTGPIDVGTVLQTGAGGVGSCLAWWLREFGIAGRWDIYDGDDGFLHNTNRSLGLYPRDTEWNGEQPLNKAVAAAALCGANAQPVWYDQIDHSAVAYDLVLPLANERSVRHHVACRGEPLLLHATTSRTWEAQFHRHIPDRDDCIVCRMPRPQADASFLCSAVRLETAAAPSTDAAVPFLSAGAALLLISGLFRLQHGDLPVGRHNEFALAFNDARRAVRRGVRCCRDGCGVAVHAPVRRRIHKGRRWSHIDAVAWGRAGRTAPRRSVAPR